MKESKVQRACLKRLKALGAWAVKIVMCNKDGCPDSIVCVPVVITEEMVGEKIGVFVGIEYKVNGKDAEEIQEAQMSRIRRCGGVAQVVRSLADLENLLNKLPR